MISKSAISSSLVLLATLAPIGATAHADNINTFGTTCQAENGSDVQHLHYESIGVYNPQIFSIDVVCGVPRSPFSTLDYTVFYIDGYNKNKETTDCILWIWNYNGDPNGSVDFTISSGGF